MKYNRTLKLFAAAFFLAGNALAANPYAGKFFASGDVKKPQFALTFDDGPGYITEDLLKLLAARNVKAAFFVLGTSARRYPERVKLVAGGGHLLCNHTDTHLLWKNEAKKPGREETLKRGFLKAEEAVQKASGFKTWLLRMPNGYDAPWVREAAGKLGYSIANWGFGEDWTKIPEEKMTAEYIKATKPGAILLLHDGGGKVKEKNLRIVAAILDAADKKGLKPVRLDELLGISVTK